MKWLENHPYFISRNGNLYTFGDHSEHGYVVDISRRGFYDTKHQSVGYRQEVKWFRVLFAQVVLELLDKNKIRILGKKEGETEDWLVQYISYRAILENRLQVHAAFTFFSGLGDWWQEHKEFFERTFKEIQEKYGICVWFEEGKYGPQPRFR